MALTFVQYTGDGLTNAFSVPFPYLDKEHVVGRVNGEEVAISFTSDTMVQFASVPPNGALIELRRETPNEVRMVDFNDGSVLTEYDLDLNAIQTFYIVQEAVDLAGGTLLVNPDGSYSANGRRISAVGAPVNDSDVVNRGYFNGEFLPQMQALLTTTTSAKDTAVAKAAEAATSASNAAASYSTAASKAAEASLSASSAVTSASTATTKATSASNSASTATTKAQEAANSASAAATSAGEAAASASAAAGHASSASTSASNASTYLTNVHTHANTATTKAQEAVDAATAANLSKDAAANSATLASNQAASCGTHATNAANSASIATTKAQEAASSATSAAASLSQLNTQAADAAASAGAAQAAADSVIASAQAAETHATNAANSATSASNSASTANTKAVAAANSATNAATSASTATDKATIATTKASEAAASATTATTKATEAANSASAASDSASAAATSASHAATKAGEAATSATNAAASASSASSAASSAASTLSAAALPSTTYASRFLRRNISNTAYELRTAAQVLADIGAFSTAGGAISGAVTFGSATTFNGAATINNSLTVNGSISIPNGDSRTLGISASATNIYTKAVPGEIAISGDGYPTIVLRDKDSDRAYLQWYGEHLNIAVAGATSALRMLPMNEVQMHYAHSNTRMIWHADGNVQIWSGDAGLWWTSTWLSDPRHKDNVQEIPDCLDKVSKIRGVTFTWNDNIPALAGREDFGVIATEVEAVFPKLTRKDTNGNMGVEYDKIAVLMIGAIKELKARVESLEAELALERGLGDK